MLTSLRQLQNKPLISLSEGKKIGEIKDLYLDANLNKITGVFLGREGGLFSKKGQAVARESVQLMGIDAWLVNGDYQVIDPAGTPDLQEQLLVGDLRGREIHTEGGTKIGVVDDVLIDRDGDVRAFLLGKVFVVGPIAERKAIARSAISTVGGKTAAMTAAMSKAEEALRTLDEGPPADEPL